MSDPLRIAMVGGGVMGSAIVEGMLEAHPGDRPLDICIVETDAQRAQAWREHGGVEVAGVAEAASDAHVIFLAVKPYQILGVLKDIAPILAPEAVVVSIAAGITVDTMQANLDPSTAVIRTMPNTATRIGQGVIGLVAGPGCSLEQVTLVRHLLEPVAFVVEVPESKIDALTATSGSGPAYVFYLAEAMQRGAEDLGLPAAMAAQLVSETISGAAKLLSAEPDNAAGLRESVTSKGGATEASVAVFEDEDLRGIIARGMQANVRRAREMADEHH
jgi:pyrroline-5-carboxylate reductase